ncbi:MAG TPA: DUF4232 domain-containing protein [Acidimicrobiia bacterium]|nr:DUF4232 domain-containing protein [Acidimicrobiia bacterium]
MGLALVVVLAGGVAALSAADGPASRSPAPPATATTTTTIRPATTAAVWVTSTTAASRFCRPDDLQVTVGTSDGAGGTRYTGLRFTNRSPSACALTGHPALSFLNGTRSVLGRARPTPGPETVTVAPGQYAATALGVASMTLGSCTPVTPAILRIGLAGGGGTISVAAGDFVFCPSEIVSIRRYSGPFTD